MIITNASDQKIEMRFENHLQNEKWNLEMMMIAQGLREMQELLRQEGVKPGNVAMTAPLHDEKPNFGLTFTVPKVCLTLRTRKKVLSKKL